MSKRSQAEFLQWMGPVLDALRQLGDTGTPKEVSARISEAKGVPDSELEVVTATGVPRFYNQVCWARQYLLWEGLVDSARRGVWSLTETGKKTHLTIEQASEIVSRWVRTHAARRKARAEGGEANAVDTEEVDVHEEDGEGDLLAVLRSMTPSGFERFCKYLLRVHGFVAVENTPKGKDGGIDGYGVLQINPFISFKVVFQCKRYSDKPVARAQVGDFRNALLGRADKGIMITTGVFSEDAKREATREGAPPIELVDGSDLVRLIEAEQIGVTPRTVYRVDPSFFRPYMTDE
jgi:restriction system protein